MVFAKVAYVFPAEGASPSDQLVEPVKLELVAWSDTFNVTSAALELNKPIPTIKNAIKAGLSTAKRAAKIGPEVFRIARDLV